MRTALVPLLGLAGALDFAGDAPAGGGFTATEVVEHIFDVADEDRSGTLSADEYAAAGLERYGVSFGQSDLDGDGQTSLAEYLELYERHHPADDEADI